MQGEVFGDPLALATPNRFPGEIQLVVALPRPVIVAWGWRADW